MVPCAFVVEHVVHASARVKRCPHGFNEDSWNEGERDQSRKLAYIALEKLELLVLLVS